MRWRYPLARASGARLSPASAPTLSIDPSVIRESVGLSIDNAASAGIGRRALPQGQASDRGAASLLCAARETGASCRSRPLTAAAPTSSPSREFSIGDRSTGMIDAVTRKGAMVGSLLFALGQPGVMGGLVPFWLTGGWDGSGAPTAFQLAGALLVAVGVGALAHTVIRFAIEGRGTPFPAAPTASLVIGGLYRYVRNPMYLAVIAIILGQAAILGSMILLLYAAIFWITVASFVRFYEEPTLTRRYGDQYVAYRRAVPGWWPRATRWPGIEAD
jgi:protein-S-isoprenylcysteine O-methyltransferase Ste14